MKKTNFKEFKEYAKNGNLVPVYAEMLADLETPVSAFLKVAGKSASAFLLESVEYGEKLGRYSFIGAEPGMVIKSDAENITVERRGGKKEKVVGCDAVTYVQKMMEKYAYSGPEGLPVFSGGFLGYIGYENVRYFEDIDLSHKKGLDLYDSVFFLADNLIIFDHLEHLIKVLVLVDIDGGIRKAYKEGERRLDQLIKRVNTPLRKPSKKKIKRKSQKIKSNVKKSAFEDQVRKIKKYIKAGDAIQVVLSQRFALGEADSPFSVYRALRSVNPSPYMFYLKNEDLRLVGSSPELLVKKDGRKVEVRPIAGTRRRGTTEEEDLSLERELRTSSKEMAEHLMLVDLGRNDIGRVCDYKTVKVNEFARTERYSHVMHLVSDVTGTLKKGKDAFDLLRATFPAGTVTGAPKVRAMQIIDELEQDRRGPYAGAVGYFSFNGDMDMCITIRTIVVKGKHAYVQAGAGIVSDSRPKHEYKETVSKAKALFKAIKFADEVGI